MAISPLLNFVRRNRAAILQASGGATNFCLALVAERRDDLLVGEALDLLASLAADEREYAISSAYALLIGADRRKLLSAYFTPPILAEAALQAADQFLGGASPAVLDPACGGGAFLAPVAQRLAAAKVAQGMPAGKAVKQALRGLKGIELDPGLASLSQALLKAMILRRFGVSADCRVVQTKNALSVAPRPIFDLVIGNPPYGRVAGRVSEALLTGAGRANLGGHTNLYGLFLLRGLEWLKPGGGLVFVLPTSFVAGPYFSGLRHEVLQKAEVLRIDVHEQRDDLFVDAVQDVCLLTLRRRQEAIEPTAGPAHAYEMGLIDSRGVRRPLGCAEATPDGEPWMLPNAFSAATTQKLKLISSGVRPTVLADYGYGLRVGKVVPTRERDHLRLKPGDGLLPLLWASEARPDGSFAFANGKRSKLASWYAPPAGGAAYVTKWPAVIVQRTSNRDQKRRLNAAAVPPAFYREYAPRGFVAENHVIVLEALTETPLVTPSVLAALLNSAPVNERFSAVSGSFSVSAKLLARLALPPAGALPTLVTTNFDELVRAALDSVAGVLATLEPSGDPQDAVDQARDLSSPAAVDEEAGLERRAIT
ncbi:MAG: Eco57I restriction-modification methylase domain-containing protein [Parcubacteria group bacterium]